MNGQSACEEIRNLETQRCAALVSGDLQTLAALLADDLVHIHGNGQIDDRAAYLKGVGTKYTFHRIERGDLNVRIFGEIAVVVGALSQTVSVHGVDKKNEIKAIATQTWICGASGWKQNTCHMAFLSVN